MGSELIGMPKHFFLIQAWLYENIVAFLGGGGEVLPTARRARRGSECLKDTFFLDERAAMPGWLPCEHQSLVLGMLVERREDLITVLRQSTRPAVLLPLGRLRRTRLGLLLLQLTHALLEKAEIVGPAAINYVALVVWLCVDLWVRCKFVLCVEAGGALVSWV